MKRVENLEDFKFFEICVGGVNLADTMLAEKSCKMCIRDKIPSHRESPRDFTVNIQEPFKFGENSHPGQLQKGFDITQGLVGRQRGGKNCGMS